MNDWLPRSWLFEIYDTKATKVVDSFTLILPPQSVSIREKQRVAITKTFDSAFVDDYGPDNLEITIRGISGTANAFPTYMTSPATTNRQVEATQTAGDKSGYNQQDAFFAFRDKIMRYKNGAAFENLIMKVYNLNDEEAYRCVLLDFTLDRTSEQPWRYPFAISLFVEEDLLAPRSPKTTSVFTPVDVKTWDESMVETDNKLTFIQDLMKGVATVRTAIVRIREAVQTIRNRVVIYSNAALVVSQIPLFAVQQIVDELTNINIAAKGVYTTGALTISQYANILGYLSGALDINLRLWGVAIQADRSGTQTLTGPARSKLPTKTAAALAIAAGRSLASAAAIPGANDIPSLPSDNEDTQLTFTSTIPYTVQGGDTLQRLALVYMNDPSLWVYIAQINGLASNAYLVPGQQIFIPITSASDSNNQNIIRRTPQDDPLGADIELDVNGDPVIAGDIMYVGSTANIVQAINSQMATPLGFSIKHTAYGLAFGAGKAGDQIAEKYIRMAVRAALLFDPRIKRVDDLAIYATADVIKISFTVTLRGVDQKVPVTVRL